MQRDWSRIIIIILVVIMVIVSVVGTIIYLKTDLLRSKEILFKKYISQNVESIVDIFDFDTEDKYIKVLQNNDYSESADFEIKYLESADDEEEIYKIEEKGVVNKSEEAAYRKILASYDEEKLLEIETLNQNNMYGFRLKDLVKQFVSIENSNLSYLVSSVGYDGKYFSEKLNHLDISELLNFTSSEIETLKKNYMNAIFSDIEKDRYSSKRNAMITLSNGKSVTTTVYALTINRNELDKIYKRVINQAINDQIIISKIEEIEEKIKNAGFVEPKGESLKERYIDILQKISDELEYVGEDKREITIKVYQLKGETLRTDILTDTNQIIMDIDSTEHGRNITLKTVEFTEEGDNTNVYSLSKETENDTTKRKLSYTKGEKVNFEMEFDSVNQEDGLNFITEVNYSNEKISKLNIVSDVNLTIGKSRSIPHIYNQKNNIVLNNYDGDKIIDILNNLKNKQIDSLEKKQLIIKTKMLNNILIWIDAKEREIENQQLSNAEKQKQKFNNKFELYAGEDLSYEHVQRLIKAISTNMSAYKVLKGNKIRIYIENSKENIEKAEEISKAITDKYTYNVDMEYSDDGYVNGITISVYKK